MSQDDTAAKDEVVADATTTDSAPVENTESEVDEELERIGDIPLDGSAPETDGQVDDVVTDKPAAEETQEENNQPQSDKPASPEDEWNSLAGSSKDRFQQTVNERNELRRKVEELEAKKAQFATEQDLIGEIDPDTGFPYTTQRIEEISWQQNREAQAQRVNQELYETQVLQNQKSIDAEVAQLSKDFSVVVPGSKDYVPEIGAQYAEALNDSLVYALPDGRQANRSTLLANGINPDTQATLVGYSTSPYKLAKLAADAFNQAKTRGETIGQAKAQKATEKMLANVDSPAGVAGKPTGDKLDDLFSRIKDVRLS